MTHRIHTWTARLLRRLRPRLVVLLGGLLAPLRARHREAGMTTAEYAVGTIAAAAFAAILYQVVTGDSIVTALGNLIARALASL